MICGNMPRETADGYSGARALVTGASGFIGRHICRRLNALGAAVHGVSRSPQPHDTTTWHQADLTDPDAVRSIVDRVRPDYVFHLASHVTGSRDRTLVLPTLSQNLLTTVYLLDAITGTPCRRVVIAGSLEESDPTGTPTSPYAAAKSAATLYARMYHALYGVPVTFARLFMVYGPDQPDTRKLVPYVTLSLLKGEAPALTPGERPVDWVHVDDVAEALVRCARRVDLIGRTIDIGTGRLTTVRSVAERIGKLLGRSGLVYGAIPERPLETVRAADPSAVEQLLGKRLIELDDGLADTVNWYRAHADMTRT